MKWKKIIKEGNSYKCFLFGLPYSSNIINDNLRIRTKFFHILKKKQFKEFSKYYVFGIPVLKIKNRLFQVEDKILNLKQEISDVFQISTTNYNVYNEIISLLLQNRNATIVEKIRQKHLKGEKIRVGFIIIWASQFTSSKLYELMKNDPNFDPIIILNKIPESLDKQERRFENVFDTSLQLLNTRYNNVFLNYYNGEYIDYSDKIDIAIFHMLHPSHYQNYMSPPYLLSKNVLCIWIPYYINVSKSQTNEIQSKSLRYKNIDYMWKIFLDNFLTYKELIMHNTYFYGYPKLDNFAEKEKNNCITIILAPHQDLNGACFCGNFLNTYNLYLEIPSIFTKIKFIFRPHPLWYPNLRIAWGEKKAQDYLNSVTSLPNVLYSTEDDYYQIFANSNALIHDCATFLAEYFVTKNPQFYLQDNKEIYEKYFNHFGMKCLENVYIGSQIDEVVDFIKNVVIQGKDYMQQSRIDFMKSTKLVDNYPNISKRIFEDIKNDLFN